MSREIVFVDSDNERETTELPEGKSWIKQFSLPDDIKCSPKTFDELLSLKPADRGKVIVYGKEFDVPRWQKSFGRDYYFSGVNHKADSIEHPYLKKLLNYVNEHSGKVYQGMLINWYMNGEEYIGFHSDDESQLVRGSDIYSFSFGETRDFVIKSKRNKEFKLSLPLENNTIIIMGGEIQKYYLHGVPKRLKVSEPRINITMRLYA